MSEARLARGAIAEALRDIHDAEVVILPLGFTWGCSCGDRGKTRCRSYGYAEAGRDRHLRNQWKRIMAGVA